jgi:hypothetical protein
MDSVEIYRINLDCFNADSVKKLDFIDKETYKATLKILKKDSVYTVTCNISNKEFVCKEFQSYIDTANYIRKAIKLLLKGIFIYFLCEKCGCKNYFRNKGCSCPFYHKNKMIIM